MLSDFMKDIDGSLSSKRLITMVALLLFITTWALGLFTKFIPQDNVVDALVWMIGIGMGATASEKFSGRESSTRDRKSKKREHEPDLSGAPTESL